MRFDHFSAALIFGAALVSGTQNMVTFDPTTSWGTWQGFGTSLSWWANIYGDRDDLADIFFTLNNVTYHSKDPSVQQKTLILPGLGLNIARYNLGGSSNVSAHGSQMQISSNMPWWKQIQGFWDNWDYLDPTNNKSWTWKGRDVGQISMLRKAISRGATHVQMFSNSPMWWMCKNHNPCGNDIGYEDNLQTWNHEQFAAYISTVIEYFRDHENITINSVEPFNEPNSNWWKSTGTQEGCHFAPSTQASILAALRSELNMRNLNITIAASDENSYTLALNTWKSFGVETRTMVDQVDVHGYEQNSGPRGELYNATRGKKLWNSEYGEGDATGLSLIQNLNLDLTLLHPTAWTYWQVVDGSSWGLIDAKDEARGVSGNVETKYWILAHYTRHIRPGFKIIDVDSSSSSNLHGNPKQINTLQYSTVAAIDDTIKSLVIVSANLGNNEETRTFNISKVFTNRSKSLTVKSWRTEIKGSDRYARQADIKINSTVTSFDVVCVPSSIFTFEVTL